MFGAKSREVGKLELSQKRYRNVAFWQVETKL